MGHTLKQGIDFPIMQQLAPMPTNNFNGSCFCSDGARYIYWIQGQGASSFYRYDIFSDGWEQLASTPATPSTGSYGSSMTYDMSRRRIYAVFGNSTQFNYYDIEANAWSANLTVLSTAPGTGGNIVHTCSFINSAGNDDYIFYTKGDGSSRKLYRYSISGNTWTEMGTDIIPSAPGSGCNIMWMPAVNTDWLFIPQGNGSSRNVYIYSISGNNIVATQELKGSSNTISTGSISGYNPVSMEWFWVEAASRRLLKSKMKIDQQLVSGTATAGSTNTLTDSSKTLEENFYAMMYITITSGTGAGQTRLITSHTDKIFTVNVAWTTPPDSTSVYEVKATVFDYGSVTAATTTTITDSSKAWITNTWANVQVKIIAGLGIGQVRYITSNTATALTVSVAWTTTPDTTSRFEIVGFKTYPETYIPYGNSDSYHGNTMELFNIKGLEFVYFCRKGSNTDWFRYLCTSP